MFSTWYPTFPDIVQLRNAEGKGKSFIVTNPGFAAITFGIALTNIATVATSPIIPPSMIR